jgi:alpha,alpha-trehalase
VPVDLNSLLWSLEMSIARRCKALGDTACAQDFTRQADARKAAISKWLWSAKEQRFVDWDRSTAGDEVVSAAMLYPLFVDWRHRRRHRPRPG